MTQARRPLAALSRFVSPDLGRGVRRFPLPCILAALLTLLVSLDLFDVAWLADMGERPFEALVALALAALGIDLLAEGRGWRPLLRASAQAATMAAVAGLYLLPQPHAAFTPTLVLALLLFVGVAGFLKGGASVDRFWRFNQQVWIAAGIALLSAAAFALGIFVIDRSLDILFGIDFEEIVTNVVFPLSFCLLAPLTWLAAFPRLDAPAELEPDHFLDRAVRLIARLILVPLLLTYTAILFAYTLQIALLWRLPQGQIGWMVSAFGLVGALTTLLLHPERQTGGRLVRFFVRWWYAATIVPVALLSLAVYLRIAEYGLTPERYLLVLVTIWLAALAILFARPDRERDMRLLPGLAALLLLAASFGPWGAMALSARSQASEFLTLAREAGWIDGDRVDAEALSQAVASGDLRGDNDTIWRARSILDIVLRHEGLDYFTSRLENPEALVPLVGPGQALRRAFGEAFDLEPTELPPQPRPVVVSSDPVERDLGGYASVLGPLDFMGRPEGEAPGTLSGGAFEITLPSGATFAADLLPLVDQAGAEGDAVTLPAFFTAPGPGGSEIGVLIVEVGGLWTQDRLDLYALKTVLFLPAGETGAASDRVDDRPDMAPEPTP